MLNFMQKIANFTIFGLTRPRIEQQSTFLVTGALFTQLEFVIAIIWTKTLHDSIFSFTTLDQIQYDQWSSG